MSRVSECKPRRAVNGAVAYPACLVRICAQHCRRRKFPSGDIRNPRARGFNPRARLCMCSHGWRIADFPTFRPCDERPHGTRQGPVRAARLVVSTGVALPARLAGPGGAALPDAGQPERKRADGRSGALRAAHVDVVASPHRVAHVLPGLESGRPRRGDGDALPRSRIAVRALGPAPRGERSEACDGDGLALSEGVGDGGEHGVDRVAAAAVVDSEVRSATRDVSCGFLIGLLVALRPIGRTAIG